MSNANTLVIIKVQNKKGYDLEYQVTEETHNTFLQLFDYDEMQFMQVIIPGNCTCSKSRWFDYMNLIPVIKNAKITGSMTVTL